MSGSCSRFLYLTGKRANNLVSMASAAVPLSEDPLYPFTGLTSPESELPSVFLDATADPSVAFDFNAVLNGDMSAHVSTALDDWTDASVSGGTAHYDATGGPSGGPAVALVAGASGFARLTGLLALEPGYKHTIVASLKGDGSFPTLLRIQRLDTMEWMTAAGAWQVAQTAVFSESSASYVDHTLDVTLPDFSACGWPQSGELPLRVTLAMDTNTGVGAASNVFIWPWTSWWSFHGLDFRQQQLAVELYRGGVALTPSYALESTITKYSPAFGYAFPVTRGDRFWKVKLAGQPSAAPWFGKMFPGQASQLSTAHNYGFGLATALDQVRTSAAFGAPRVRTVALLERRVLTCHFRDLTQAAYQEFLELVMRQSNYGAYDFVAAPIDDEPRVVILGTVPAEINPTRATFSTTERDFVLTESPFPAWSA